MLIRLKAISHKSQIRFKNLLFIIPYLFTYLNAIFGFLSILKSGEGDYAAAAYYIMCAAFMDAFDGRIARALGLTSCFGMELDSLCDAISFCLAPTILLYSWFFGEIGFLAIMILALYLCAGLARLAKFNTTSVQQHNDFIGLPTTIAAVFIASLVYYNDWIEGHYLRLLFSKQVLFPIISFIAYLMLSNIRFYSFKSLKFSISKVIFCFLFSLAVLNGYPLIFIGLTLYILIGLAKKLLQYQG